MTLGMAEHKDRTFRFCLDLGKQTIEKAEASMEVRGLRLQALRRREGVWALLQVRLEQGMQLFSCGDSSTLALSSRPTCREGWEAPVGQVGPAVGTAAQTWSPK